MHSHIRSLDVIFPDPVLAEPLGLHFPHATCVFTICYGYLCTGSFSSLLLDAPYILGPCNYMSIFLIFVWALPGALK